MLDFKSCGREDGLRFSRPRPAMALAVAFIFLTAPLASAVLFVPVAMEANPLPGAGSSTSTGGCQLNSASRQIQHVIYIVFDNTHFTRDNPNVPSDLEQMPHVLNFIKNNGVLLTNHHTPLISHTATDILDNGCLP